MPTNPTPTGPGGGERPSQKEILNMVGVAYETGYAHAKAKAKSRTIATPDGLIDGVQWVMQQAEKRLWSPDNSGGA